MSIEAVPVKLVPIEPFSPAVLPCTHVRVESIHDLVQYHERSSSEKSFVSITSLDARFPSAKFSVNFQLDFRLQLSIHPTSFRPFFVCLDQTDTTQQEHDHIRPLHTGSHAPSPSAVLPLKLAIQLEHQNWELDSHGYQKTYSERERD